MATSAPPSAGASAPEQDAAAAGGRMTHRQVITALSGMLLAMFTALLSSTVVSNALPTIVADLDGTQRQYTWVVTATLLASTATTPVWGKLSDLFSKKLLVQVAITIFTLGSVLAGLSHSMGTLIGWRVLQGVGLGGLQALVTIVIAAMISPRERGRYSGPIAAVISVAPVIGPLIGGLIVDSPLGWRWCFFVGAPLAAVSLVVIQRTLDLPVVKRQVHIDYLGAALIMGGVSALLIWVTLAGQQFAWTSGTSYALGGLGVVLLVLAVWVESRAVEPIIPLRLFRARTTTLATTASVAVGVALFGGSVFLGQYFQIARGYSPTAAGLLSLPMILGSMVSSIGSGILITRTGRWKRYLVTGSVLMLVGFSLLATIDHTTPIGRIFVYLAVLGLGLGMTMQNLVLAVQNTVRATDLGSATSTVTFFRSLGGTVGVSVLGVVLADQVEDLVRSGLRSLGIDASGGGGADLGSLGSLPGPVADVVRSAYGDGTGHIFLISAALTVVTVVAVALIKEVPLRTTTTEEQRRAEEATASLAAASGTEAAPTAPAVAAGASSPSPAGR